MTRFSNPPHKVKFVKVVSFNAELPTCICLRIARLDPLSASNVSLVKM